MGHGWRLQLCLSVRGWSVLFSWQLSPSNCFPIELSLLIPLKIVLTNGPGLLPRQASLVRKMPAWSFSSLVCFLAHLKFLPSDSEFFSWFVTWLSGPSLGHQASRSPAFRPAKRPRVENGTFKKSYVVQEKKGITFVIQWIHSAMWKRLVSNYLKLEKQNKY